MPYKKLKRRHLFCRIIQSQLSRHIGLKQRDEVAVADNLQLARAQQIQQCKRKGISDDNKIEARKEKPSFQGERNARKTRSL